MQSKKILLIDTSATLHILKHSTNIKTLKKAEIPKYIIFSFLFRLQILTKIKPDICVFAMDSHSGQSKRRLIFPEYKLKRKTEKTPEQIELDNIAYPQFDEIENKIIPGLGYSNIFRLEGYEADDVIGKICKEYPNNDIIIVSTDQDLYQLLSNTICILNAKTLQYYTKAKFMKQYGIEPKMWKRVKTWSGCGSDEVPGLPGIGEKTVIKFIKGELPTHYKTYKTLTDPANKPIVDRNKSLTILPFRGTPSCKLDFNNKPKKDKILEIGKKYNFNPIIKDFDFWCKVLQGV